MDSGVSVKFLMVGETNSMVGYHLMAEGYSIQLGSGGGCCEPPTLPPPPAGPEQCPDNNNNVNINNNHSQISASSSL